MIPVQLTLRNFLSYGDAPVTLDFSDFRVACLSGDNGHGKSALLDALTYALWGEGRKGRSERKADEGLLRLGATDMEVSLTFDLDSDRYSVMRRFAKRSKRSITELDLQVFDAQTQRYRPLTDSTSTANTQRQLDDLLCMDYTTFVNSAFLLQGRDAEFTRKTPRERKQVLAEILGLSRYDRLQQLAKQKLNLGTTQVQQYSARLSDLDIEISQEGEHETAMQQVAEELKTVDGQIEHDSTDEQTTNQALLQARTRSKEADKLRVERPQLVRKIAAVHAESAELKQCERDNQSLLDAAESIETDFVTYTELKSEETALSAKSEERWQLSQSQVELESSIRDIRHQHERECERHRTQKTALGKQLREHEQRLAEEKAIETAYTSLCALREREDQLKKAQLAVAELELERSKLNLQIDSTQKSLEAEADLVRERCAELEEALTQHPTIEAELAATNNELGQLREQTEDMEVLRERGTALAAEIERDTERLQATLEELSEMSGRAKVLGDSTEADCPLCGSPLDREHREQLEAEMVRRKSACESQVAKLTETVAAKSADVAARRVQFQELEEQASRIAPLQTKAAQLCARSEQLDSVRSESARLSTHREQLCKQLSIGDYANDERSRLHTLEQHIEQSDFSSEELVRVQAQLRELSDADAERRHLDEARSGKARVLEELAHTEHALEHTERILREESFAGEERTKLSQILTDFAELAYDAGRHESIREHLSDLAQAVQMSERLDNARRSQHAVTTKLSSLELETNDLEQKLVVLDQHLTETAEREAAIPDLESRLESVQARLQTRRAERDQLLARRGAVEGALERCRGLKAQRKELRAKLATAEQESWIYARLDEAFGKDGIQALIIEGAIPEIESEANALLGRLTDNRIQVSLESLKDLKSGATRETLDIKIADELGERAYDLYSGGEAFRTNFALRVALSKVLARRSGTRLRTLIIDEGFGTQDGKGLESMVEAIQEISRDFDKILVVTHLPLLRDAFPTQIHITKDPQYGSTLQLIQAAAV